MKKIFASLLIAAIALSSCKKDDTICYNNVTMGNIVGENIVSDQGNTFDIVESLYTVELDSFEYGRVLLSCDVLKKTAENKYDIRLTGIASVLTKETVPAALITPESEMAVDDPIVITDIWYGGGYINMSIRFAKKVDSKQKHLINLVYDGITSEEDGSSAYTFTLRHNAYTEIPAENDIDQFELSEGYVSFPVANLIEGDKAKIKINWNTHPVSHGNVSWLESEKTSRTYDWKRIGFEQSASTPTVPNLKLCRNFLAR